MILFSIVIIHFFNPKVFLDHSSVEEMRRKHVEPIALSDCLEAFCSEEVLEYSCDKCKKVQQAAKKLQIWRLPPILVRNMLNLFCFAILFVIRHEMNEVGYQERKKNTGQD